MNATSMMDSKIVVTIFMTHVNSFGYKWFLCHNNQFSHKKVIEFLRIQYIDIVKSIHLILEAPQYLQFYQITIIV